MLPIIMRIKIVENGRKKINLFIPVVFVWILLAALLIVLFPFVLLFALLSWRYGGKMLLLMYPMLAAILVNLSPLTVDIESPENKSQVLVYMK